MELFCREGILSKLFRLVLFCRDIELHQVMNKRAITIALEDYSHQLGRELNTEKCGYAAVHWTKKKKTKSSFSSQLWGSTISTWVPPKRNTTRVKYWHHRGQGDSQSLFQTQKSRLFNSCDIAAAVYVKVNIYLSNSILAIIMRCRDLDLKEIDGHWKQQDKVHL